jgi:hypothetical protein
LAAVRTARQPRQAPAHAGGGGGALAPQGGGLTMSGRVGVAVGVAVALALSAAQKAMFTLIRGVARLLDVDMDEFTGASHLVVADGFAGGLGDRADAETAPHLARRHSLSQALRQACRPAPIWPGSAGSRHESDCQSVGRRARSFAGWPNRRRGASSISRARSTNSIARPARHGSQGDSAWTGFGSDGQDARLSLSRTQSSLMIAVRTVNVLNGFAEPVVYVYGPSLDDSRCALDALRQASSWRRRAWANLMGMPTRPCTYFDNCQIVAGVTPSAGGVRMPNPSV